MKLRSAAISTPVGALRLVLRGEAVCAANFEDGWPDSLRALERRFGACEIRPERDPAGVVTAFEAYLAGDLDAPLGLAVDTAGTPFQSRVWSALRAIPAGETRSYGAIGRAIGAPSGASRAIGAANHHNPIAVLIPCHRVIGANGTLTGYAGGLDRKAWLLRHEGAWPSPAALPLFASGRN